MRPSVLVLLLEHVVYELAKSDELYERIPSVTELPSADLVQARCAFMRRFAPFSGAVLAIFRLVYLRCYWGGEMSSEKCAGCDWYVEWGTRVLVQVAEDRARVVPSHRVSHRGSCHHRCRQKSFGAFRLRVCVEIPLYQERCVWQVELLLLGIDWVETKVL